MRKLTWNFLLLAASIVAGLEEGENEQPKKSLANPARSWMSYGEALHLAVNGHIFPGVIQAMKRELSRAEATNNMEYINQIKVNIGVGLMQLGRRIFYANKYAGLYEESEKYFLSVLSVDPRHELAKSNLESVRRNKNGRQGPDLSEPIMTDQSLRNDTNQLDSANDVCRRSRQSDPAFVKRWLTIGIPTISRPGNPEYLLETVNAITSQLPTRPDDPLFDRIIVVILNNSPNHHPVFEKVRQSVESGPYKTYFRFEEAEVASEDGINNPENHIWLPGARVIFTFFIFENP